MQHLDTLPGRELAPGLISQLIHGERSTVSFVSIEKDAVLPIHHHPHEQITYIVEGELEMSIGEEKFLFTPGMFHVIASNTPHGARARSFVRVIDFFSPARDDYR